MSGLGAVAAVGLGLGLLWGGIEIGLRVVLAWPLPADFYGSISRERVRDRQKRWGVRVACGSGWIHLGWIADPERERYRIERRRGEAWRPLGTVRTGSFLVRGDGGTFRVLALPRGGDPPRVLGEVRAEPQGGTPSVWRPVRAGSWRLLFRPRRHGRYVNDHAVYRDAAGHWRLLGITGPGDGDWARERWFAAGASDTFPPPDGMRETEPVADFGELAWAPHVIRSGALWHLFWSPHVLRRMTSQDGVRWTDPRVVMAAPRHRFFRDAFVLAVADGQWLLYATARGRFFSRVDVYQSFDLEQWQYIGPALRGAWGSRRNAAYASMESPSVTPYHGGFYLTITYNNGTAFWHALALALHWWPRPASYHESLVFQADNPYEFGVYRGARRGSNPVARLEAHAPRLVHDREADTWWVTTAGWPWAATLTRGEVAVAPLRWEPVAPGDAPLR